MVGGLVTKLCRTLARQAPLSMGFSKQDYWSVLPFPSPGDLPDPGIEPQSPALQADSLPSELPGKPNCNVCNCQIIYYTIEIYITLYVNYSSIKKEKLYK